MERYIDTMRYIETEHKKETRDIARGTERERQPDRQVVDRQTYTDAQIMMEIIIDR